MDKPVCSTQVLLNQPVYSSQTKLSTKFIELKVVIPALSLSLFNYLCQEIDMVRLPWAM